MSRYAKRDYMMWLLHDQVRVKLNGEAVIALRWNPGRQSQFIHMVTQWEQEDAQQHRKQG